MDVKFLAIGTRKAVGRIFFFLMNFSLRQCVRLGNNSYLMRHSFNGLVHGPAVVMNGTSL